MTLVTDYRALLSGYYWYPIPDAASPLVPAGQPVVLSYSFSQAATASVTSSSPAAAATFQAFSESDKAIARAALAQWSAASGVVFVETTQAAGDITFGYYNLTTMGYAGSVGLGYYPNATAYITASGYPEVTGGIQPVAGDVYVDTSYAGNAGLQADLAHVLVHEVGHALGLKHPFDAGAYVLDPDANPPVDTGDNTVMSYTGARNATLGPLDASAISYLYGNFGDSPTSWTWSWDATSEIYTVHALADDVFVRGIGAKSDVVYAAGLHDAVVTQQGDDVIYADGQPFSANAGAGNDTVYTGLSYADLVGGVGGSGEFRYIYLAGDYQKFYSVETLVFTDGAYSTATNSFVVGAGSGVSIAALDANKAEGDSNGNLGSTPFTFTVSRTDGTAARTVNWAVAGSGTHPTDLSDFIVGSGPNPPSGTLSFAAGQLSQTLTLAVRADTYVEPDETFSVTLTDPTSGLPLGVAQGTILNDDTTVSIAPTSTVKNEGDSGSTPFIFTVTRAGLATGVTTVVWTTSGAGTTPSDFVGGVLPSGTLTFAAGETTKVLTVAVRGDTVVEPDEYLRVALSNLTGLGRIEVSETSGRVINDDVAMPQTLSIAASSADKAEGNTGSTPFTFKVTRSGGSTGAVTASWEVLGQTGYQITSASASDFAGGVWPAGTISFADGQVSATITVNVAGDSTLEADESFTVVLLGSTGASVSAVSFNHDQAGGVIRNDDATLTVQAFNPSQAEGRTGATPFVFWVTRGGSLSGSSTAAWSVTGVTPNSVNAADFVGGVVPQGTVSFAPGALSALITVEIQGDTVAEPDESFRVVLSGASAGSAIIQGSATSTVLNDDTSFFVAAITGSHAEGNSGATPFLFTVIRSGVTTGSNDVVWYVTGAAPNSVGPLDFVGGVVPGGTLSFAPGVTSQTVTVNVAGDTQLEPDEWFQVGLRQTTGGASVVGTPALSKIVNDETSFAIAADVASKAEGNAGSTAFTFTVTRGGNVAGTHSIGWLVSGVLPNSVGPADFVPGSPLSGALLFAPGEVSKTITVLVQGDTYVEPDEHFMVLLRNASAAATIVVNNAQVTVLNDDGPAPGGDAAAAPLAAADFNGDRVTDSLRAGGDGGLYVLDGASGVTAALTRSAVGMRFVAAADFAGHGESALLLQGTGGGLYEWTLDGALVLGSALVAGLGAGQSVAKVADLTGDGRADILLHDAAAADPWTLLAMDGTTVASRTSFASAQADWHLG